MSFMFFSIEQEKSFKNATEMSRAQLNVSTANIKLSVVRVNKIYSRNKSFY